MNSKIYISACTLLLILWSETFYKDSLYEYTLSYTPTIQANTSEAQQIFWFVYSFLALFAALGGPFIYEFFWRSDIAAAVFKGLVVAAISFFVNFFKLFYHDPRPFWSSDAV